MSKKETIKYLAYITIRDEPFYIVHAFISLIANATATYFLFILPKTIIQMIEANDYQLNKLNLIFGGIIIFNMLGAINRYWYIPIGYRIRYRALHQIITKSLTMPYEDFENPEFQDNIWKIYSNVNNPMGVQGLLTNLLHSLGFIGVIILSSIMLSQLNILFAIITLLWAMIYIYRAFKIGIKKQQVYPSFYVKYRESNYLAETTTTIAYAKEIRVFSIQEMLSKKLHQIAIEISDVAKRIAFLDFILARENLLFQFIRDIIMYGILISSYYNGKIDISLFASYGVLIAMTNQAYNSLLVCINGMSESIHLQALTAFLGQEDKVQGHQTLDVKDSFIIKFENVSFTYPKTDKEIYHDLNLTITAGKKIAIIGLNGVGKTTLLKLLMRLYVPTKGRITINGVDIQSYKIDEYYTLFAPVFQDFNIFSSSVYDNIDLGRQKSKDEIIQYLKDSKLDEVFEDLQSILDQPMTKEIDDLGIVLSGGQTQKLLMARALSFNRPILILDEPTSALDAIAEHQFYMDIKNKHQDKTILFVSHRLASTQFCDEIIFIDDKTIKEQGSHEQLMANKGMYYDLFMIQSQYYKEVNHEKENQCC